MASVVIDQARGGTLYVGGVIFDKGVTEVPTDRVSVEDVRRACEDLPWVRVVEDPTDYEAEADGHAQLEETLRAERGLPEPEPALPVPGEELVAAAEIDEQKATRAERLADLVENDGADKADKADKKEYPCPHEGCGKVLKSASGLRQHVKLKHTDE